MGVRVPALPGRAPAACEPPPCGTALPSAHASVDGSASIEFPRDPLSIVTAVSLPVRPNP